MSIKMRVPPNFPPGTIFMFSDGSSNAVAADNTISIPEKDFETLFKGGLKHYVQDVQFQTLANAANSAMPANAIAGARICSLLVSGGAALSHTTDIAANMIAQMINANIGDSWFVRIINTNSGNLTIVGGSGVSFNGTNAVATNKTVEFMAKYTAANTIVLQNIGFGAAV